MVGGNLRVVGTVALPGQSLSGSEIALAGLPPNRLSLFSQKGFIPLALDEARELAAGVTQNAANNGGILASDTTPAFERVNAGTDIQFRLRWVAANVDELQWQFAYPLDLDETANVEVHLLASMSGATNTPTVQVKYFEGVGGTDVGGNTAAITGTALAEYSVIIPAASVSLPPRV